MIHIEDLKKETRKIEIQHGEDTLHVEYRLNAANPLFLRELKTIEDTDENLTRQLQELVVHWDLLDENGQEVTPTVELIASIRREFWQEIIGQIVLDMRGPADEKKG
jgi:hypothetical protein